MVGWEAHPTVSSGIHSHRGFLVPQLYCGMHTGLTAQVHYTLPNKIWERAKTVLLSLAFTLSANAADLRVENSNFVISEPSLLTDDRYLYDYDRLRVTAAFDEGGFFLTAIGDLVTYGGRDYLGSAEFVAVRAQGADIPFDIQSPLSEFDNGLNGYARLYRLYGGYHDDKHSLTVGIQNITMGVGRFWTPTNLYNPKNVYAYEPDEVYGILGASYTYSIADLASVRGIVSVREDESLKYALSVKGFVLFADMALDIIKSDDILMVGYELEGNLFDTGAEYRSEGGYFRSDLLDTEFWQAIVGLEYGFVNGITWTVEGRYSSETFDYAQIMALTRNELFANMAYSKYDIGTSLSYNFNIALSGAVSYIESLDAPRSRFIAPSLQYTLDDHNIFTLGAMVYDGEKGSVFEDIGNSYYFSWKLSW